MLSCTDATHHHHYHLDPNGGEARGGGDKALVLLIRTAGWGAMPLLLRQSRNGGGEGVRSALQMSQPDFNNFCSFLL